MLIRVLSAGMRRGVCVGGGRSFDGGPRMEVPSPVWMQGPWSPVGYQVVEVASETDAGPQARRQEDSLPTSPLGYRVVVREDQQPAPAIRPAKRAHQRKGRPLVRWGAVAA